MTQANYNDPEYDYTKYWQGREYENAAEELALKKLLPVHGESILDLGGGFGRLSRVYGKGFKKITIADSSSKILGQAKEYTKSLGLEIETIETSVYELSQNTSEKFDCVIMVRVAHHLDDLKKAFDEVYKVLNPNGVFILEFANKLHAKSLVRELIKGNFNYLYKDPVSRAGTNSVNFYNFHPASVAKSLNDSGFKIQKTLSVSNLRLGVIKRFLPLKTLTILENTLQAPLAITKSGPSIFVKCIKS